MKIKFLKLAECLITDKQINSNELRIYIYLINLFNREKGCSYPSIETIAEDVNLSSRTVKNCIARLVKIRYMEVEKKKSVKGNYNTYKNFKFMILDKKQEATPKVNVDSNGQKPIDGQIGVEEALEQVEKEEINKIIKATGATEEEAREELRVAKSKEGIKDIIQYTIGTINNKKRNEKELEKTVANKKQEINPKSFNNFPAREYDYDDLERKLLGWENTDLEEVEETQESTGYDFLKKYGIGSAIAN